MGSSNNVLQRLFCLGGLFYARVVAGQLHDVTGSFGIIGHLEFHDILGVGRTVGIEVEIVKNVVNWAIGLLSRNQFQRVSFSFRVSPIFQKDLNQKRGYLRFQGRTSSALRK